MAEEKPEKERDMHPTLPLSGETASAESCPREEEEPFSGRSYLIGKKLGEGGMAVVNEAFDGFLQRKVAIKRLKPDKAKDEAACRKFFEEAKIMAKVENPGTVPVYEAGSLRSGECFYAMRLVRGRTLRQILNSRKPDEIVCPHTTAGLIDVFERVCQSVAFAHSRGVIHRDLKPENIMVDEFGTVLVLDWGIAKKIEEGDPGEGEVKGTPSYMSPEQALGKETEQSYRSDVWSLGVILYEILTGKLPFKGRTYSEILEEILYHEPENPRKIKRCVDYDLAAICMKALAKDPRMRYPTAKELAQDIRRYREYRAVSAAEPTLGKKLFTCLKLNPSRLALLAMGIGLVLFALGFSVGLLI